MHWNALFGKWEQNKQSNQSNGRQMFFSFIFKQYCLPQETFTYYLQTFDYKMA